MQEELENRTVTLMVSGGKFTGRTLKTAIVKFLGFTKNKVQAHKQHKSVIPKGKQSVKDLVGQNMGVETAELKNDAGIKAFDRVARKYGVDYAIKKIEQDGQPKYLIFFKARDSDAILSAMTEYANRWADRGNENRPSLRQMIRDFAAKIAGMDRDRAVNREISR